jgi:hypothetical protein
MWLITCDAYCNISLISLILSTARRLGPREPAPIPTRLEAGRRTSRYRSVYRRPNRHCLRTRAPPERPRCALWTGGGSARRRTPYERCAQRARGCAARPCVSAPVHISIGDSAPRRVHRSRTRIPQPSPWTLQFCPATAYVRSICCSASAATGKAGHRTTIEASVVCVACQHTSGRRLAARCIPSRYLWLHSRSLFGLLERPARR